MGQRKQLHSGKWGGTVVCNSQGDSGGTTPQVCKREPLWCFLSSVSVSKMLGVARVHSKLSSHRKGEHGEEAPLPRKQDTGDLHNP